MIYCRICGAENRTDSKYCRLCGAVIPGRSRDGVQRQAGEETGWICWRCGTVMGNDILFCTTCGMIRESDKE